MTVALQQRTYGELVANETGWTVTRVEPQVALKMKAIFPRIPKGAQAPFVLTGGSSLDADLYWFLQRYPMHMKAADVERVRSGKTLFETGQAEILSILAADWQPSKQVRFRENRQPWRYQAQAAEMARRLGRLLIADDIGLGKTISALATVAAPECLPAAIVVPAHLADQWVEDYIEPFTHMTAHIIKGTRPYELPNADLYVFKYSNIAGWVDYIDRGTFKAVVFDEMQELRTGQETAKGRAANVLTTHAGLKIGLTASPIYNYGNEIWEIMEFLEPGALGTWFEFQVEWTDGKRVRNPQALGSYLRELNLIIRRLEDDPEVGKAMPLPNTVVQTIPFDEDVAAESEDLARQLAINVTSGSFTVSGQAAREFNALMRQMTGVAKARHVAAYVRMLLDAGRKVLVAGWHREVYEIWNRELAAYNPVMYTGTESRSAKKRAKQAFVSGATDVMFISLRSGTGLDGLQDVCHTAVVGELDWSPEVHKQFFGRLRRPGQREQVDAIYLVADGGADPVMIEALGVKSSQSRGIKDPFLGVETQHTDATRIKALAEAFLRGGTKPAGRGRADVAVQASALGARPQQAELFVGGQ